MANSQVSFPYICTPASCKDLVGMEWANHVAVFITHLLEGLVATARPWSTGLEHHIPTWRSQFHPRVGVIYQTKLYDWNRGHTHREAFSPCGLETFQSQITPCSRKSDWNPEPRTHSRCSINASRLHKPILVKSKLALNRVAKPPLQDHTACPGFTQNKRLGDSFPVISHGSRSDSNFFSPSEEAHKGDSPGTF